MQMGKLALELGQPLPLKVLPCDFGYCLGTELHGVLFTRESVESWSNPDRAQRALEGAAHEPWKQEGHLVANLLDDLLDRAVALAEGEDRPYRAVVKEGFGAAGYTLAGKFRLDEVPKHCHAHLARRYSRDWLAAGELLDRENVWFEKPLRPEYGAVFAYIGDRGTVDIKGKAYGPNRRVAGLRAILHKKFGTKVHF